MRDCTARVYYYANLPARTSNEQRIELTRELKGERFPDGRSKVPDDVLEELKTVDAEEAWGMLQSKGYKVRNVSFPPPPH